MFQKPTVEPPTPQPKSSGEGELNKRLRDGVLDAEVSLVEVPLLKVLKVLEEAKADFPLEFWWDVVLEQVENGSSKIERERMPNATLEKNRANAVLDKKKTIDWFERWFGASK